MGEELSEPLCFEAIIKKLERYTLACGEIEAKCLLLFQPKDEEWEALSKLHKPEGMVKVVMTE